MADLVDAESRALVALTLIPGLGPLKIKRLVDAMKSAENVLIASAALLQRVRGIGPVAVKAIQSSNHDQLVDEQFASAEKQNTRFIRHDSDEYPSLLRHIHDPPPFLWVKGSASIDWHRAVAVVGTRRPSEYGKNACRHITGGLCKQRLPVISGLAYGIDAIAHREAVKWGCPTIAVLGSGLDRIYPSLHRRLAGQITENGWIVSTFPFGTAPDAQNFPQRNRIISGMARATVVVEAFEAGGALITAASALDQNREVMAVPGSIFSEQSSGTNQLIKNGGAKLVQSANDILVELAIEPMENSIDASVFRNLSIELSSDERKILDALDLAPTHLDDLCRHLNINASDALSALLVLELKGLVRSGGGTTFTRT